MSIPVGHLIWGIQIEGICLPGSVLADDQRIRFATEIPLGDSEGLYRDLLDRKLFDRIAYSIDFRDGSRATIGALNLSIINSTASSAELLGWLARLRVFKVAEIQSAFLSTDTSVDLGAAYTGKSGTVVFTRREAYILGPESPAGVYSVPLATNRGWAGTPIQDHDPDAEGADVEVFEHSPIMESRRVDLFYQRPDGGYSNEEVIWSGAVDDLGHSGLSRIHLSVLGDLGLLRDQVLLKRQWVGEVSQWIENGVVEINGRTIRDPVYVTPKVPEWSLKENLIPYGMGASPSPGDRTLIEFKGSIFELELVSTGEVNRYVFDPRAPFARLTPPLDDEQLGGGLVRQIFCSDPRAPFALSSNPLTLVLEVLTSTREGTNGANDRAVDFGVGVPFERIDVTGIERLRGLKPGLAVERFFIGRSETPEKALDRLEAEVLAPFDLGFSVAEGGALTLVAMTDVPVGYTERTLTLDDLLEEPKEQFGWPDVVDRIRFRHTPAGQQLGDTRIVEVNDSIAQRRTLGAGRELDVDGSAIASSRVAFNAAMAKLLRWRKTNPDISLVAHLSVNLVVGRTVKLTMPGVVESNPDPVEEVTASRVLITSKELALDRGAFHYRALHVGLGQNRLGQITASGQVASYASGTGIVDLEPNAHVPSGGNGVHDYDVERFAVSHVLDVLDEFGTRVITSAPALSGVGVDSGLTQHQVQFTTPPTSASRPSGPVATDVLVPAEYPNAVTAQTDEEAYVSDADGQVNAGGEGGYQWAQ